MFCCTSGKTQLVEKQERVQFFSRIFLRVLEKHAQYTEQHAKHIERATGTIRCLAAEVWLLNIQGQHCHLYMQGERCAHVYLHSRPHDGRANKCAKGVPHSWLSRQQVRQSCHVLTVHSAGAEVSRS